MDKLVDSVNQATPTKNGLFANLAVVALFLSIASSAAFGLSFCGGRLAHYPGSPSDEAVLYSFLYGLVGSQIVTLFLPRSSLAALFSIHFMKMALRSLVVVVPCWLIVALGGSELSDSRLSRIAIRSLTGVPHWEEEWFQISFVLLATSLTFLTWHVLYNKRSATHPASSPRSGITS